MAEIFELYTGNQIPLTEATSLIAEVMPGPVDQDRMDAYLDASFATYRGVPELIEWCLSHDICFMFNTTGAQGYFQRVFARNLLPPVPIVAANPLIRFPGAEGDPRYAHEVREIVDKPKATEAVIRDLGIPPARVIVIGDSGGDGPHFQWGASNGAFLIGSMTKSSLRSYCARRSIEVHKLFGVSYGPGERRNPDREMRVNFRDLGYFIEALLDLTSTGVEVTRG